MAKKGKKWLSSMFGRQGDAPADEVSVPQEADAAATLPAPAPKDAAAIRAEEEQVPLEWSVGAPPILDLYEVKEVFESGGMGLVYCVHHKGWNLDLAVKSPRAKHFQTEAHKANFVRECESWVNLGLHPNIVSCYYVRTLGGVAPLTGTDQVHPGRDENRKMCLPRYTSASRRHLVEEANASDARSVTWAA